ncbi:MAG: cytochrome ubiquinol oxidase subunit I [Anaerolineales bacterium]|nr:cytochrome ubiquinol oxidase subunit I [Anaerolineales bacterium]
MDPILIARLQFGITTVYHFFFVPLTLGLSVIVAIMETLYVRTGKESYKAMTKFWGKLFLINFAMGVVTGIVQEFQFGMNWSEYSRFVGDIFGAPLAIEALLAFFLESTFLGVWIFGWDKLSKGLHAIVIWLVALGSNLSALWILIANSFMQEPVGYALRNGRAEMVDFGALITNPNVLVMFPHTVLAGFSTAAFFVLGISAYHLLHKRDKEVFQRSFNIAAIFGLISVVLLIINGHGQAQHMVRTQPMKMAAAEALFESEDPAGLSLITITDLSETKEIFSLRIPAALSLLAYNRFSGEVKGINNLQAEFEQQYGAGDYVPPVMVSYWSFRAMVGAGFLMAALAAFAVFLGYKKSFQPKPWMWKGFIWAIALPYLANTTGWLMTELGRSPWVVYGLMKIKDAVSPTVGAGSMLISLIGFTLIYAILMVADIYLLKKFAKAGILETQDPSADDMLTAYVVNEG